MLSQCMPRALLLPVSRPFSSHSSGELQTDSLERASIRLETETLRLDEGNSTTSYEISRAEMGLEAAKNEGKWLRIELDCMRKKVCLRLVTCTT